MMNIRSEAKFRQRLEIVAKRKEMIHEIECSAQKSSQEKMVELLGIIATELVDNNFWLEEMHSELFEHTLALERLQPD